MEEAGKLQCQFGIMISDFVVCLPDGTIESMSKFMFKEKYGTNTQMIEVPTLEDFIDFYRGVL